MPHQPSPDHGGDDDDGGDEPPLGLPSSRVLGHRNHLRVNDNRIAHSAGVLRHWDVARSLPEPEHCRRTAAGYAFAHHVSETLLPTDANSL